MPSKYDDFQSHTIGHFVTPSPLDPRDHIRPLLAAPVALPSEFIQSHVPIRNQGHIGSCGAFGAINALEYEYAKQGVVVDLSEQFQYAVTRTLQGSQPCEDAGSIPREAMRVLTEVGALLEQDAPYMSQNLCWRPDSSLMQIAGQYRALEYFKPLPTREAIKACLYGTNGADGHVVAYCCLVYQDFDTDRGGYLRNRTGSVQGAHWMSLVGYSESRQAYRVRNQWGPFWGDLGYCWIRYADAERPPGQGGLWVDDAWAVRVAFQPQPRPTPEPLTPWQQDFNYQYDEGYRACGTGTSHVGYVRGWEQRERELGLR